MLHGVSAAIKALVWLSCTAVLTLLTQCASPLTFGNDTKANVETGLSQVILKSVSFSPTNAGTGFVSSSTPITATLEIINPKNLNVTYALSATGNFSVSPVPSPTSANPTSLSFTFTPALGAELSDLVFTLGKTAASIGKTFANDTFTVRCDSPPSPVGSLLVGTNATNSFIEFTKPTASTDADLASFVIAYQDLTASTSVENVTYPVAQLTAVIAELASAGGNQRYFMPSDVVAGHAYTFWVTVVDATGQKSSTQVNSSAGVQYALTFDLNDPVGNILTTKTNFPNVTVTLPAAPTRTGYAFNGWNTAANGTGTTTILRTATTMTNNLSNATLYAQWVPVTVVLTPATVSLVPGNTQALTATILPAYATVQGVNWVSSNPAAATVDASGNVTAVASGSTTITATAAVDGISATRTVTVGTVSVTGVSVLPTTLSMVLGAGTQTLTPTVVPVNASNQTVNWSTSNSAVATVVGGVVTAVGGGSATITATTADGGFLATCAVTVTVPVSGVAVAPTTASLYTVTAPTTTLTATVSPGTATNQTVSWASSNTSVATVNSATGVVASVNPGTATITATTADGGFTSSSTVTVIGQGSSAVTFSPTAYQTLSFTSTNLTIAAGATLSISPSAGVIVTSGTSWNWYINGVILVAATGSGYTFSNSTPGFYTVEVTVVYGSVIYSGSVNVTVTQ